jgi:hypothetical protein
MFWSFHHVLDNAICCGALAVTECVGAVIVGGYTFYLTNIKEI